MNRLVAGCLSATAAACALLGASAALADDTVIVEGNTTAVAEPRTTGPNPYLLRSGLFTLGLSYAPALVVATESDFHADDHLYIPVAGPWLDLANRGDSESDNETVNKVLLVTDGVFQGLGALQVVAALAFPGRSAVTVAGGKPDSDVSISLTPARFAGGQGVLAVGEF